MDEQELRARLTELAAAMDPDREYEFNHPDIVFEIPQSGERIRGRDKLRAMRSHYHEHGPVPKITLRRLTGAGDLWFGEGESDYGGQVLQTVSIMEFRDGKLFRNVVYYTEPFPAPEWRAPWVERTDEVVEARA